MERMAHGRLVYARIFYSRRSCNHRLVIFQTTAPAVSTGPALSEVFRFGSGQLFTLPALRRNA